MLFSYSYAVMKIKYDIEFRKGLDFRFISFDGWFVNVLLEHVDVIAAFILHSLSLNHANWQYVCGGIKYINGSYLVCQLSHAPLYFTSISADFVVILRLELYFLVSLEQSTNASTFFFKSFLFQATKKYIYYGIIRFFFSYNFQQSSYSHWIRRLARAGTLVWKLSERFSWCFPSIITKRRFSRNCWFFLFTWHCSFLWISSWNGKSFENWFDGDDDCTIV